MNFGGYFGENTEPVGHVGPAYGRWRDYRQLACKPGSVWLRPKPERGSHSSGTELAFGLAQPTRMTGPETG